MKKYNEHCYLDYDEQTGELIVKYLYKKNPRKKILLVNAILSSKAFLQALLPIAVSDENKKDIENKMQNGDFHSINTAFATLPKTITYFEKECCVNLCVQFINKEHL